MQASLRYSRRDLLAGLPNRRLVHCWKPRLGTGIEPKGPGGCTVTNHSTERTDKRPEAMLPRVAIKALTIWLGILLLAVANGVLREGVLLPGLGLPAAQILSGLLLSALILGVAYLALPWLQVRGPAQVWAVGFGWLALTLAFEFSFGLWQGKSWPVLLEAYTFRGGNLWPVVLVTTALAPYIATRLRGWMSRQL